MARLQIRRGLKSAIPTSLMLPGEQFFATDRGTMHVATDAATKLPLVPAIDDLATLPSVDGAADFLIIHDTSENGAGVQKEKKMTINAFRAALSIPEGSTDEKVAAVSGGEPGFLYGTDGTDGVLRTGPSLTMFLPTTGADANKFVRLDVDVIDCGTF
jgi:hypothetical protein